MIQLCKNCKHCHPYTYGFWKFKKTRYDLAVCGKGAEICPRGSDPITGEEKYLTYCGAIRCVSFREICPGFEEK